MLHLLSFIFSLHVSLYALSLSVLRYRFGNLVWDSASWLARCLVAVDNESAVLVKNQAVLAAAKQVYTISWASIVISPLLCLFLFFVLWQQPVSLCCPLHQLSLHYVLLSCSSHTWLLISFEVFTHHPGNKYEWRISMYSTVIQYFWSLSCCVLGGPDSTSHSLLILTWWTSVSGAADVQCVRSYAVHRSNICIL